jgi:hypothetical protein
VGEEERGEASAGREGEGLRKERSS